MIDAVATHDEESGELLVFAVNRSMHDEVLLSIGTAAFPNHRVVQHLTLSDPDIRATNTREHPDRVVPRPANAAEDGDDGPEVVLAPVSWNVIGLQP